MRDGTATVLRANARRLPVADNSVDLIITSPPYFGLRSYQDGGVHYAGQVGDEPTPAEFVDALIEVTRECIRVLKPSGSLWVNLGDKYASSGGHGAGATSQRATRAQYAEQVGRGERNSTGVATKSLIGIPWRYALRCIDDLGLILRAELIWSKPNGLPESVTDRVRRSHEQWFHFTLEPRYYSAVDTIREPQQYAEHHERYKRRGYANARVGAAPADNYTNPRDEWNGVNPLGKLPGSVWTVPTEPLAAPAELGIEHFAAFPTEWPKQLIRAWCPAGVCTACGEGRRPVVAHTRTFDGQPLTDGDVYGAGEPTSFWKDGRTQNKGVGNWRFGSERDLIGYACTCTPRTSHRGTRGDWKEGREVMPEHGSDDFHAPGNSVPRRPGGFGTKVPPSEGEWEYHFDGWTPPPTRPGVVLDVFGGTGTTAMVAKALGRTGITVDMSWDYCRMAAWRTTDRNQLAKVLGLERIAPADPEQLDLFT